jgi:HAE1 family hydrophobic/amphiphilic exporter-1
VIVRPVGAPASLAALRDLTLVGKTTVADVATVREVDGPVQLTRIDGKRSATISGKASGSDLGATTTALETRLDALTLPAGATSR